jgi:uncharacterized protein YcfL
MNRITITILALMLTSGCVKPPNPGRADPYAMNQISFAEDSLQRLTAVGTPLVSRPAETNLLNVTVPVRSASGRRLLVEYQGLFFDDSGVEIDRTAWMNKTLEPNVQDTVSVRSLNPKATNFRIAFRYARMDP